MLDRKQLARIWSMSDVDMTLRAFIDMKKDMKKDSGVTYAHYVALKLKHFGVTVN